MPTSASINDGNSTASIGKTFFVLRTNTELEKREIFRRRSFAVFRDRFDFIFASQPIKTRHKSLRQHNSSFLFINKPFFFICNGKYFPRKKHFLALSCWEILSTHRLAALWFYVISVSLCLSASISEADFPSVSSSGISSAPSWHFPSSRSELRKRLNSPTCVCVIHKA